MSFGVSPITMKCSGGIDSEMFADAVGRQSRKIAADMRLFAKRARQREELIEAHQLHLELGHRLDVAGQQRRTITRMLVQCL